MIYLNDKLVNTSLFPDNTSQVWKLDPLPYKEHVRVLWEYSHEGEFLQLAQLKWLLDRQQCETVLDIPYLPYARQDKETTNTTTFALRPFAKLLNSLKFKAVFCDDPHSEIAQTLINNLTPCYPVWQIGQAFQSCKADIVCYPDKGAEEKYTRIFDLPYAAASKVRVPETGAIESIFIPLTAFDGKRVLIVDDICDGGATFIQLAKTLLNAGGASEVNLFVTHGLFTRGKRVLFDAGINRIFTAKGEVSRARDIQ